MKHDKEIIRDVRKLATKECANWCDGSCLPYDTPCSVINPAYSIVHDGCVDCDCFVQAVAENVLKRDFNASRPNEKWVTDVTEFKWYDGPVVHKLYLSAILDLYDRSIVGYVLSRRSDNSLVFSTFDQAIKRNPDAKPLFHSDRGFQYTSKAFQCKLAEQGMTQSMSRVGNCIDNGPTEGFWGIVKAEMYNLQKFTSEEDLRRAIEDFIRYYNEGRYQARFGFKETFPNFV